MERRQLLAIVLMFIVLVAYQIFYVERFQKRPKRPKLPSTVEVTERPPAQAMPPIVASQPSLTFDEEYVRVLTSLYEATFSTRGAALVSFKLRKYPLTPGKGKELVDLIPTGERALVLDFDDPGLRKASMEGIFAVSAESLELSEAKASGEVTFTYVGPKGSRLIKRLTFHDGKYGFEMDTYVKRPDDSKAPIDHRVLWAYGLGGGNSGYGAYTTVSHLIGKDRRVDKPGKLLPLTIHKGSAAWSAIQTKYFAAILAARNGVAAAAVAKQTREKPITKTSWTFQKRTTIQKVSELAPGLAYTNTGEASRERILVFAGPKLPVRLKSYGSKLERVIDHGWFGPVSRPLLALLLLINRPIGNYGVSIILLTIAVKGLFFPLSVKQQKSMRQMTTLQPRLKALQVRYKNDKQKLNKETMDLYKREKVNPLGGCLPLLVQFPVIIALYTVLGEALELRGAHFFLWITDLSVPESLFVPWFHVLPILMGGMMLLQNHIAPATAMGGAGGDPRQQQMLKYMPIIFLFIFWGFPAGLNLYWTVYTVLGIGEQFIIKRRMPPEESRAS